jgi:16S rRNA (cytosine1402-N4)-methyltransferase
MSGLAPHEPVMVREVAALLMPERGGVFVDCTVGAGGHSAELLARGADRVIGLDRDPAALAIAADLLEPVRDRVELVHADFRRVAEVLDQRGLAVVDGAVADLGLSSMQLAGVNRGFSFQRDEPLDMRMDPTTGPTAADLLERASEEEIADAIYRFGEERASRRIARRIVEARSVARLRTTGQLAAIVRRAGLSRGRIDPATRTFQAIRIWVNRELEGLDRFVRTMVQRLRAGGRLVIITFHSLEDRIVKHTLRALDRSESLVRVLTKKPLVPTHDELARNPRARSAKLRAAERLA